MYSNSSAVPLERPANLGAKEFYTDAELKANQEAAAAAQLLPLEKRPSTK